MPLSGNAVRKALFTGGDEVLIITVLRFISQPEVILSHIFYIYLKASLNSYYILTLFCSTTLPV